MHKVNVTLKMARIHAACFILPLPESNKYWFVAIEKVSFHVFAYDNELKIYTNYLNSNAINVQAFVEQDSRSSVVFQKKLNFIRMRHMRLCTEVCLRSASWTVR